MVSCGLSERQVFRFIYMRVPVLHYQSAPDRNDELRERLSHRHRRYAWHVLPETAESW